MPKYSNKEVVQILKEVLAGMEVKGFSFFRIRAYQNAIAVLDNLTSSIYDIWQNGKLDDIPGIGEGLSQHLNELFTKGTAKEFERAKKDLPDGMFALLGLRTIGSKRAYKLATVFKLSKREDAIEKLKKHAESHEIQIIEGFGEKSEKEILNAIDQEKMTKKEKPRMLLIRAEEIAQRILNHMSKCKEILQMEFTGSYRRRNETVGDLDLIVSTNKPQEVIDHFVKFSEIDEVLAKGEKKVMVNLKNDVQVDIRISTPEAYGALIQYNTGSKQHNILLRTYSLELGLSLSEYGIKNVKTGKTEEFKDEKGFYERLSLPYIPCEIRQGTDEIEKAIAGKLPKLVELKDIKGDLHVHTNKSDGINTLQEMVDFAAGLEYEYVGITDHAPSVIAKGYKGVEKIILGTRKEIDEINKKQNKIKVLFGYEVNILADSKLGLPDEYLKLLDYVDAGIHTSFNQDKESITKRLISAIENEYVHVITHPVGRLINEREPYQVDWQKVFDAAKANKKVLEINAQPYRLDLTFDLARQAQEMGIMLAINTDAHEAGQMLFMKYGVDVARRAWCERKNILNTQGLDELASFFKI